MTQINCSNFNISSVYDTCCNLNETAMNIFNYCYPTSYLTCNMSACNEYPNIIFFIIVFLISYAIALIFNWIYR